MNVLSGGNYPHIFTGKQINDWCKEQVNHGTSRWREARRLLRKNYKDDRLYISRLTSKNSGCGSGYTLVFERIEK